MFRTHINVSASLQRQMSIIIQIVLQASDSKEIHFGSSKLVDLKNVCAIETSRKYIRECENMRMQRSI